MAVLNCIFVFKTVNSTIVVELVTANMIHLNKRCILDYLKRIQITHYYIFYMYIDDHCLNVGQKLV